MVDTKQRPEWPIVGSFVFSASGSPLLLVVDRYPEGADFVTVSWRDAEGKVREICTPASQLVPATMSNAHKYYRKG